MRTLGRLALVLAIAVGAVVTTVAPAGAHGVGGVRPTNYETRLTSISPQVPGIQLRVVDLGTRLELANHTGRDVVVLGYDDEPYLRVGPRGVYENVRSPSTYINRTLDGKTPIPKRADEDAPPEWRRIDDEPVARWHDHRAHWMNGVDAPAVERAPDETHVVQRFELHVRDDDRVITAKGDVRWVPGPSPWPWLALAAVTAIALVLLARTRFAVPVLVVALAAVFVIEIVHVVGAWDATTLGVGTRLGASVYALGAAAVSVVALVWVLRRGVHAAAPLLLVAGLFVGIAGGLTDLTELTRSQLPTTLPLAVARACVALALGLGIGLAVTGGLRLRGSAEERRQRHLRRRGTPRASSATTSVAS